MTQNKQVKKVQQKTNHIHEIQKQMQKAQVKK